MNDAPRIERWLELACDAATGDVALADEPDLGEARADHQADFSALERVAAALAVGLAPVEAMPEAVCNRLIAKIPHPEKNEQPRGIAGRIEPEQARPDRWRFAAIGGWAVAAVLALVAAVSILAPFGPGPSPAEARLELIASGAQPAAWNEWSDEAVSARFTGVSGDVVWDDRRQEGYMRFTGLPVNDPTEFQYQLWILDGRYDNPLTQRISGGVFDVPESGEIVVPIREGMPIDEAVGFAVTIERPGGVWISDMTERVVIALKG